MHTFSDSYSFKVVTCQYTLNSKDITTMQDISSTLNYLEKLIWVFLTSEVWFFFFLMRSDQPIRVRWLHYLLVTMVYFLLGLNISWQYSISIHFILSPGDVINFPFKSTWKTFHSTPWGVSYCIFFIIQYTFE